MTRKEMLEMTDINAGYQGIQALWNVSIKVNEGEIVALVGNNGAGKTTTLRAIMGIIGISSGEIKFKQEKIEDLSIEKRAEMGITIAPEEKYIFPDMTVHANLRISAYGVKGKEMKKRINRVYELFPRLQERTTQYADTLSGGERQMLNIGSALMRDPELILIDEPTLGLAPMLANDILDEIREISNLGKTILLVEQNVNKAFQIADRGYVLKNGRVELEGSIEKLTENSEVKESYLGV